RPLSASGGLSDLRGCTALISAESRKTCWQKALLAWHNFRSETGGRTKPDLFLFGAAVSACEKGGHWAGAVALLRELREARLSPDRVVLNAVISAFAQREGGWVWALQLLAEMRKGAPASAAADRRASVEPNVITYNAAISCCEKGRQWQMAFVLLRQLREARVEPSVVTCGAVLSACEKGLQWRRSLSLLGAMRQPTSSWP
ncbi:unnamed protein product, partial [Polarella glacialis]